MINRLISSLWSKVLQYLFDQLSERDKKRILPVCPKVYLTNCNNKNNASHTMDQSVFYYLQKIMPEENDEYSKKYAIEQKAIISIRETEKVEYSTNNHYVTIECVEGTATITYLSFNESERKVNNFPHKILNNKDKITFIIKHEDRPRAIIIRYEDQYTLKYELRKPFDNHPILPIIYTRNKSYRKKSRR